MSIVKRSIAVVYVATLLLIQGCGSLMTIPANPSNPIRSVAILPMVNETIDVDAPEKVRTIFAERLAKYHYQIQPIAKTNDILNGQFGISLGKQLALAKVQQLGEKLGVDGVFYGYLINFDKVTTGIYNHNKVQIGWKLVSTRTGEIMWGHGAAVKSSSGLAGGLGSLEFKQQVVPKMPTAPNPVKEMPGLGQWRTMQAQRTGGNIGESIIGSLVGAAVEGLMNIKLNAEVSYAYDMIFTRMLVGPGVLKTNPVNSNTANSSEKTAKPN